MGTTADKLQNVIDVKNGLSGIIDENGKTIPTLFSKYPETIDTIIDEIKGSMIIMDSIVINSTATTTQLNKLFENLPDASSFTSNVTMVTMTSGLNVRDGATTSGTNTIGKIGNGDSVPVIATENNFYKVYKYRRGNSYSNPLRTYNSYAYFSAGASYSSTSTKAYPIKNIDISKTTKAVQTACKYKVAESKGWNIIFNTSIVDVTATETVAAQTVSYSFNDCFTDNYSNSSYSTKSSTNTSTVRQGYYSYYYKGNFRFSSTRLSEIKSIFKNSTVSKIEVYVQRSNTNNGVDAATPLYLYASDSTGANADVAISNGTTTLTRGQGTWITLSDTIKNGFVSGKYNHLKVYKASTALSNYMVFETNAKMRITYSS